MASICRECVHKTVCIKSATFEGLFAKTISYCETYLPLQCVSKIKMEAMKDEIADKRNVPRYAEPTEMYNMYTCPDCNNIVEKFEDYGTEKTDRCKYCGRRLSFDVHY